MRRVEDKREASLSIGALSQQTGVHIETIRYYERVNMLAAPPRPAEGRRVYGQTHRRTLGFIRRARDLSFSLDEIRALLDLGGSRRASCQEVRTIASLHLANVRAKLADLARLEAVLSETVAQCAANMTPACPMLGILETERDSLKSDSFERKRRAGKFAPRCRNSSLRRKGPLAARPRRSNPRVPFVAAILPEAAATARDRVAAPR